MNEESIWLNRNQYRLGQRGLWDNQSRFDTCNLIWYRFRVNDREEITSKSSLNMFYIAIQYIVSYEGNKVSTQWGRVTHIYINSSYMFYIAIQYTVSYEGNTVSTQWGRVSHIYIYIYICIYIKTNDASMVQIMVCRLNGTKPLSDPMLEP